MRVENGLDALGEQRARPTFPRAATCARSTRSGPRHRGSRRRPCDAKRIATAGEFRSSSVSSQMLSNLRDCVRFAASHTAATPAARARSARRFRPTGNSSASSIVAIGSSVMRITRHSIESNLRPTHTPAPSSVRAAVSLKHFGRFDRRHRQALGRAVRRVHLRAVADTGQRRPQHVRPALAHRRKTPAAAIRFARPFSRNARSPRATPPATRTPASPANRSPPRAAFRGSADAGREKSISGNTVVTPIAELNSANSGKHARSTPPGSMPYVD